MSSSARHSEGAPSLAAMARRVAVKNIEDIETFADIPVHIILPIVKRVTSPEQLRLLEQNSPQLLGHTVDLWRGFIKRDFPEWAQNPVEPSNPGSWWKVWRKLKREDDAAKAAATEQLRKALGQKAEERQSMKTTVLHTVLPGVYCAGDKDQVRLNPGVRRTQVGVNAHSSLRKQIGIGGRSIAVNNEARPLRNLGALRGKVLNAPASMLRDAMKQNKPQSGSSSSSQGRASVQEAPASMLRQYNNPSASSRPSRPAGSSSVSMYRRKTPMARNPFRSSGSNMSRHHEEAMRLAMKLEKDTDQAQKLRDRKKAAEIEAQRIQTSPPMSAAQTKRLKVSSSPAKAPSSSTSGASTLQRPRITTPPSRPPPPEPAGPETSSSVTAHAEPPKTKAHASPPLKASTAAAATAVKRKQPNIFLAPKEEVQADCLIYASQSDATNEEVPDHTIDAARNIASESVNSFESSSTPISA